MKLSGPVEIMSYALFLTFIMNVINSDLCKKISGHYNVFIYTFMQVVSYEIL